MKRHAPADCPEWDVRYGGRVSEAERKARPHCGSRTAPHRAHPDRPDPAGAVLAVRTLPAIKGVHARTGWKPFLKRIPSCRAEGSRACASAP